MKVLFTCGGTAGHINPAVALAGMFRQRQNAEVLFVGADGGMETTLVPRGNATRAEVATILQRFVNNVK